MLLTLSLVSDMLTLSSSLSDPLGTLVAAPSCCCRVSDDRDLVGCLLDLVSDDVC